ncbi:MAG TPA: hypothetical protein VHX59_24675 [Mycobacteriales bacterium]|nr:hypothetical protein [Mycobacteriales bacterium]
MVSLELAIRLRDSGLRWSPARGDRFVVATEEMDEDVFVLSDMTIEVREYAGGKTIGFNGTTEWALDQVQQREAVWLPAEDQLREKLGGTFRELRRDGDSYRVVTEVAGRQNTVEHPDPAEAYGLALLELITGEPG